MKTTLDLPDDVALTLRLESARRGGRKKASLSRLVADAVRQVYRITGDTASPQVELKDGRVIVAKANDAPPVDRDDLDQALTE